MNYSHLTLTLYSMRNYQPLETLEFKEWSAEELVPFSILSYKAWIDIFLLSKQCLFLESDSIEVFI